jgi:hypothetical protein
MGAGPCPAAPRPHRGFLLAPECEQLPAQAVALPFGLFAAPALLCHAIVQRGLRHLAAGPLCAELIPCLLRCGVGPCLLDRLGVLWGLLRRHGEPSYGHGLLHDDLVFAAVLVPKVGHFVLKLGYERVAVGVYPFVLNLVCPASITCVHAPMLDPS